MKRGEIWLCSLDPTVGSEMKKTRPCVVVSPNDLNKRLRTVLVVPMTSVCLPASFRVPIQFRDVAGLIVPDQIRAVDRRRLVRLLGEVDPQTLTAALDVLTAMFAP